MANELNAETLKVALKSIDEFAARELPDSLLIELDERDEFPEELVRRMSSGEELGIQLLFVPYEYGGMGGGAFDVYRVCERMAAIDLGLATSELATFLGSDPIRVGGTEEQKREYMSRIAKEGVLFAYGATEPEAGSDLGALKTTAEPVSENGTVTGYRISGAKQWISNGGVADLYTILALAPGGPSWFVVEVGRRGLHARQARGQARHPAEQHRGAVPRQGPRRRRPARRRRRGPGPRPGPAGVRLHEADGGRLRARRRLGGARPRDPLLPQAHPGRRTAVREGGLHAQADRPPRGRAGGVAGGDRGDRRAAGRGRGRAERRGRDRQVPRHRGRGRGGRRGDPGPRRLRLHPRLHGREDQARRSHHQDLRGHLGDHGDHDRARPLAGAPEVRRRPLPRAGARARGAPRASIPPSAPTSPRSPTTPSRSCSSAAASSG